MVFCVMIYTLIYWGIAEFKFSNGAMDGQSNVELQERRAYNAAHTPLPLLRQKR